MNNADSISTADMTRLGELDALEAGYLQMKHLDGEEVDRLYGIRREKGALLKRLGLSSGDVTQPKAVFLP